MNFDLSFYSWDLFHDFILKGLWFSLTLTAVAALGGTVLGTGLALMRRSPLAWLRGLAAFYVNGMRSVPLVRVILWFYLLVPFWIGRPIGAEWSAFITFKRPISARLFAPACSRWGRGSRMRPRLWA